MRKKNSATNNRIRAHLLIDEVIEIADATSGDLELQRIRIAARQWAVELLLRERPSEPKAEESPIPNHWEKLATPDEIAGRDSDHTSESLLREANKLVRSAPFRGSIPAGLPL
jgi:hypothetical protein